MEDNEKERTLKKAEQGTTEHNRKEQEQENESRYNQEHFPLLEQGTQTRLPGDSPLSTA